MKINKDTFCIFRWDQSVINFSASEIRTCCRTVPRVAKTEEIDKHGKSIFLNSDYLLERRKEMLDGVRHEDCKECWDMEDKGLQSFRKTQFDPGESSEEFISRVADTNPANFHYSQNPHSLILFIGNTCDLKCLYCGSTLSTSWAQEELKFGVIDEARYKALTTPVIGFDDLFWNFFDEKKESFYHISFVGGEPLAMKKFYQFLERITEAYEKSALNHRLTICVTSNLNASEKTFETFLNTIKKLRSHHIEIKIDGSIDTTGDRAAYIRSGVSWDRWKANFEKLLQLKDINLKMTVIPSISALSISSFGTLIDELAHLQEKYNRPIRIQENLIMTPSFLSPLILTPDYADYLEKVIPRIRAAGLMTESITESYAGFVERLMENIRQGQDSATNSKYRREFTGFIKAMDKRRETDFHKTFPEMKAFFELCERS